MHLPTRAINQYADVMTKIEVGFHGKHHGNSTSIQFPGTHLYYILLIIICSLAVPRRQFSGLGFVNPTSSFPPSSKMKDQNGTIGAAVPIARGTSF